MLNKMKQRCLLSLYYYLWLSVIISQCTAEDHRQGRQQAANTMTDWLREKFHSSRSNDQNNAYIHQTSAVEGRESMEESETRRDINLLAEKLLQLLESRSREQKVDLDKKTNFPLKDTNVGMKVPFNAAEILSKQNTSMQGDHAPSMPPLANMEMQSSQASSQQIHKNADTASDHGSSHNTQQSTDTQSEQSSSQQSQQSTDTQNSTASSQQSQQNSQASSHNTQYADTHSDHASDSQINDQSHPTPHEHTTDQNNTGSEYEYQNSTGEIQAISSSSAHTYNTNTTYSNAISSNSSSSQSNNGTSFTNASSQIQETPTNTSSHMSSGTFYNSSSSSQSGEPTFVSENQEIVSLSGGQQYTDVHKEPSYPTYNTSSNSSWFHISTGGGTNVSEEATTDHTPHAPYQQVSSVQNNTEYSGYGYQHPAGENKDIFVYNNGQPYSSKPPYNETSSHGSYNNSGTFYISPSSSGKSDISFHFKISIEDGYVPKLSGSGNVSFQGKLFPWQAVIRQNETTEMFTDGETAGNWTVPVVHGDAPAGNYTASDWHQHNQISSDGDTSTQMVFDQWQTGGMDKQPPWPQQHEGNFPPKFDFMDTHGSNETHTEHTGEPNENPHYVSNQDKYAIDMVEKVQRLLDKAGFNQEQLDIVSDMLNFDLINGGDGSIHDYINGGSDHSHVKIGNRPNTGAKDSETVGGPDSGHIKFGSRPEFGGKPGFKLGNRPNYGDGIKGDNRPDHAGNVDPEDDSSYRLWNFGLSPRRYCRSNLCCCGKSKTQMKLGNCFCLCFKPKCRLMK